MSHQDDQACVCFQARKIHCFAYSAMQVMSKDWHQALHDDKTVKQLHHFSLKKDVMIKPALCFKSMQFNQSMAKWFHHSRWSVYVFWDDLWSQTGFCLKNVRRWKIAQNQWSLLVLQLKGIQSISLTLEYQNNWEELTEAEAPMSQWPLPIQNFDVPLDVNCVDNKVMLCEFKLSETDCHCGRHNYTYGRDGINP